MLRRRRLASRHRGSPAAQHHAPIRVPSAHAPPRALPNRRGAQHPFPHENSTGHQPPPNRPGQARGRRSAAEIALAHMQSMKP